MASKIKQKQADCGGKSKLKEGTTQVSLPTCFLMGFALSTEPPFKVQGDKALKYQ